MQKRIDLHIHTNLSDGYLSKEQVIDEAYENNVSVVAIADHDTIDAYTKDFFYYANKKNIKLISAVEISTRSNKVGIHVLGYNFDIDNKELKDKLIRIRNSRHEYLYNISKKLKELGYYINTDKLDKIDSVTKAHISLDIISNSKNNDLLLKTFNHIPNKGEFIETIMNEDCPAYVKKEVITPKEASELIRNANGKVVLAHPVAYTREDKLSGNDILNIIREMNPDGIEANYLYIDSNNKIINEIDKWNNFAKKNNLFVTIGSDFHKSDSIRPSIGFVNTNLKFENELIDEIINNLEK